VSGVARFKLEHSHGSRVLKKRRHADLKEDGTLGNFEKRRDCGSKRGHKQGSLPLFLKEQADQRAGHTLEESDAIRDGHIMKAMQEAKQKEQEGSDELLETGSEAERTRKEQKRLAKSFRKRLQTKKERHQELMKPESEKLKKKYDDEIQKLHKTEKTAWSQQMSIEFQVLNDKYLRNPAKMKWIARKSTDRETIRNFGVPEESVLSADAVVDMLRHPDTLSRHIRLVAKVGCWDALSKKWCVGCLWGATGSHPGSIPLYS